MSLSSKTHFTVTIIGLLGCLFVAYWTVSFIVFIIIGDTFDPAALVLLPVLIVPLLMLFIFHHFLDRLKFTETGVVIYKLKIIEYKNINWADIDYFFYTIETGKGGSAKAIYLVKNKTLILRISESEYRNYDKINDFISSIVEDKGYIELGLFESFKYFTKGMVSKLP